MNIKLHSSELNRMMKTIVQCVDDKIDRFSNIEVSHDSNMLTIRATNGTFQAMVSTPLLGGDGERFCVDGTMFAKVCAMCNGDVTITSTEKDCIIKGNGRTRLPIVQADVPAYKGISDNNPAVSVKAEDFSYAFGSVAHAISTDQGRVYLTGVLTEVDETGLRMTTLDGFRMAIETIECDGDPMKVIIPGTFMKLVQNSIFTGENVTLRTDDKKVEAVTEGMRISCGLLVGEFPDTKKLLPSSFKTECLVKAEHIRNALKSSGVLNSKQNLVKIALSGSLMKVMSNSEKAEYEAEIDCDTHGDSLTIAFNQKYLTETIGSIGNEDIVLKMNTMLSPCVIQGKESDGIRLILPVRVAG